MKFTVNIYSSLINQFMLKNQTEAVESAKRSSKFFEVEITLRLFGVEIAHWIFPPSKS